MLPVSASASTPPQVALALQNFWKEKLSEVAKEKLECEVAVEPEEESEGFSLRHNCSGSRWCACEKCLRAFALTLRKRAVISLEERDMADDIIVYSVNGNAYRIESLTRSSTFLDFYQEARKALGLKLRATSTSLALLFHSAAPNCNICPDGGGARFRPDEVLAPKREPCRSLLKGCRFQAVITSTNLPDWELPEVD